MADLKTTYMGIPLQNPVIAGASGLTASVKSIVTLAEGGAGAVVTKSLFQEEIELERFKYEEDLEKNNYRHPEMISVHPDIDFAGPKEHLVWVKEATREIDIPLIASLNATDRETWLDYARRLADTGVAGLECNLFASPREPDRDPRDIEQEQVELVGALKEAVDIPVSVKLSTFYTNPVRLVQQLDRAGADACVLFNRLFEPDIDIESEEHSSPFTFSRKTDYRLPLRFAGLLEGTLDADICCSSGFFDGNAVLRAILAGATAVQVVSTLYANGLDYIASMTSRMEEWMDAKNYGTLGDFRGTLSKRHTSAPWNYTRLQYARLLMNPEELVKNAPTL